MNVLRIVLPVVLGIVAAVLNFMVLRGSTAPSELTAIRSNVPANTELTAEMLEPLQVRADPTVFKSAVPYSQRGLLLGRRIKRSLEAGEILLYADVESLDQANVRQFLKPGESTLTLTVNSARIAPGLRRGDPVGVLVAARPENAKKPTTPTMPAAALSDRRILGPFRLLGLRAPVDTSHRAGMGDVRMVIVAVTRMPDDRLAPSIAALDEAIAAGATSSDGSGGGVLAVEYYQPAK